MKLTLALVAGSVCAGKADSRGKSGRQDLSNERYIWKTPRCLAVPDMCDQTCQVKLTSSFGVIDFTAEEYTARKHCLWTIDVPADRTIALQFTYMDIEWHNTCGYDKVHVLDGNGENERLGRFCGPKADGTKHGARPFDGTKKNKPINGSMGFWDEPFETNSHTVLVGFDSDSDNSDFGGFTLRWTSSKVDQVNFRDVDFALEYVQRNLLKRVQRQEFPDNGVIVLKRAIISIFNNANRAIDESRPRKCARSKTEAVSDDVYEDLVKLNEGKGEVIRSFKNYTKMIARLVLDYIGTCKGSQRWNRTAARLLAKWDREMRELNN